MYDALMPGWATTERRVVTRANATLLTGHHIASLFRRQVELELETRQEKGTFSLHQGNANAISTIQNT